MIDLRHHGHDFQKSIYSLDYDLTVIPLAPDEPWQGLVEAIRFDPVDHFVDQLIDMGVLPDSKICLTRVDENEGRWVVALQGFEISLNHEQADAVVVLVSAVRN